MAAEVFGPAQTDAFTFSAQAGFRPVESRYRRLASAANPGDRAAAPPDPRMAAQHGARAHEPQGRGAQRDRPGVRPAQRVPPRPALVVTVHNAPAAGGVAGAIYRVLELIVARTADSVLCVSPDPEQRMRTAGARRVGQPPGLRQGALSDSDPQRHRAAPRKHFTETRAVFQC